MIYLLSAIVLLGVLIAIHEFGHFIGEDMRLEPVILSKESSIDSILSYFMGKNTPQRQEFIINNLRVEDELEEDGTEGIDSDKLVKVS